jgi:hypothetical protein
MYSIVYFHLDKLTNKRLKISNLDCFNFLKQSNAICIEKRMRGVYNSIHYYTVDVSGCSFS